MANRTELNVEYTLNDKASAGIQRAQNKLTTFSKKFQENWKGITAGITASIFAVGKAWDLVQLGAKVQQQEKAFNEMATSFGANADKIIADMKKMSGETLSTSEAIQAASRAMTLGLDPAQFAKLTEISRAAARAMGEDVQFMFDSITLGIGRQSKMILDNLGIIVKAEEAYEQYAKSIGKTAESLTDSEKRQAFFNATVKAGQAIVDKIDLSTKSWFERMQKVNAEIKTLKENLGKFFMLVAEKFIALGGIIGTGLATIVQMWSNAFDDLLATMFEKLTSIVSGFRSFAEKMLDVPGFKDASQSIINSTDKLFKDLELKGQKYRQKHKSGVESMIAIDEQYLEKVSMLFGQTEENGSNAFNNLANKAINANEKIERSFADLSQTSQNIIKQMSSNMTAILANGFFDIIKGRFEGLGSMVRSMGDMVLRMLTQMIAKFAIIQALNFAGAAFGVPGLGTMASAAGGFANGGRPPVGRPYLVGERGPEMRIDDTPGTIISNENMAGLGGGVNQTNNFFVSGGSPQENAAAIAEELERNNPLRSAMMRSI